MKEHSAKLAILKQLADGDFHSGEVLGAQLGISRAAISKHIQASATGVWMCFVYRVKGINLLKR